MLYAYFSLGILGAILLFLVFYAILLFGTWVLVNFFRCFSFNCHSTIWTCCRCNEMPHDESYCQFHNRVVADVASNFSFPPLTETVQKDDGEEKTQWACARICYFLSGGYYSPCE